MRLLSRFLLGSLLAALVLGLVPGTSAAAIAPSPGASYFGMTDNSIGYGRFPDSPVGSVRLWDTMTAWANVETSRGHYDWTVLDEAVSQARMHGASISLVLGGTPTFYASVPDSTSPYGAGFNSSPTSLTPWARYVRAVATRYKGRIMSYEPINEIDIGMFYLSPDADALAQSRVVYNVVKQVDPRAIVTSPSMVDRLPGSQYEMMRYLSHGGIKYADVISYHPYGMPKDGPEQNAFLVSELRRKLAAKDMARPIWSTELNYGLPIGGGGVVSGDWSPEKQSAFVSRTYLLQYAAGARRVYWYNWSAASFLGVQMADAESGAPAMPALAFATVRSWMSGRFLGCSVGSWGGYTCRVRRGGNIGYIKWHPTDFSKFVQPKGTYEVRDMLGHPLPLRRTQYVAAAPVVFWTR